MKRPVFTPLNPCLLAATLMLAAGGLRADDAISALPAAPQLDSLAPASASSPMAIGAGDLELLKSFDANEAKLDEQALSGAPGKAMQEPMARPGANLANPANAQVFREKMLEMFDKNHDGRLDDGERAEARKYAEAHGLGEGGGAVRGELVKRFDKNGDGKLDAEETAAMRKFLQERRVQAQAVTKPAGTSGVAAATADPAKTDQIKADKLAEKMAKRRAASMKAADEEKKP